MSTIPNYLVKGANIISFDAILEDYDVLIIDGLIHKIDKNIEWPQAHIIEAQGKYLIPGLADMHVHLESENDLKLFVANGITTVRNMWGNSYHLGWKKRTEDNLFISPYIYSTSAVIDGRPPIFNGMQSITTKEEAIISVQEIKEVGFDQVKIYNRLTKEPYDRLIEEAGKVNLKVVGHVPNKLGIEYAIRSQYGIDHLSNFLRGCLNPAAIASIPEPRDPGYIDFLINNFDETAMQHLVDLCVDYGVWNCVTLVVMSRVGFISKIDEFMAEKSMEYVSSEVLASWNPDADFRVSMNAEAEKRLEKLGDKYVTIVRALRRAGARVLVGTDTPNPFVVPGFSIHHEFEILSRLGYSNAELMHIATKGAADFMGANDFGSIEVGKRADLVLLDNNPLENIANLKDPWGVLLRGNWIDREQIEMMLAEIREDYRTECWFRDLDIHNPNSEFLEYEEWYNDALVSKFKVNYDQNKITVYESNKNSSQQNIYTIEQSNNIPIVIKIQKKFGSLDLVCNLTFNDKNWEGQMTNYDGRTINFVTENKYVGFLNLVDFILVAGFEFIGNNLDIGYTQSTIYFDQYPFIRNARIHGKKTDDYYDLSYSTQDDNYGIRIWMTDKRLNRIDQEGKFGISSIRLAQGQ